MQAVGFDFFDTLVELNEDSPSLDEFLTASGYPCPRWLAQLYTPDAFDGRHTHPTTVSSGEYERWRRNLLDNLLRSCGVPLKMVTKLADEILRLDRTWTVRARAGAIQVLTWLRGMGVPIGICSNWDYDLHPYFEQAGLPVPDVLIVSARIGARKPHPAPFMRLAGELNCEPNEVVFVGDSLRCDLTGAVHSGMRAIWITNFTEAGKYSSDISVCTDLNGVLDVLKGELAAGAANDFRG